MNKLYIIRRIFAVIVTVLSAIIAPVILMKSPQFEEISASGWFAALPVVLMSVSIALAICFRQTRVAALALVWLGLTIRGVRYFAEPLPEWHLGDFALVVSTLLPWLSLCLFLMAERRALSSRGIVRFYLALVVLCVLYWLPGLGSFHNSVIEMPFWMVGNYNPANLNISPLACVVILFVSAILFIVDRPETPALGRMFTALVIVGVAATNASMDCWPDVGSLAVFRSLCLSAGLLLIFTVLDGAWRHAYVDELTQLPGRRPMRHHFASLGDEYAIAVVDIDHFKRVNDRHGHDVGDQVLRFIAGVIRSVRGGTAYRFGGEEFVIVFGKRQSGHCEVAVDELRERIAGRRFSLRGASRPNRKPKTNKARKTNKKASNKQLKITVSIGLAWPTDDNYVPDDVLGLADKALYKAKKGGRNKVCVS